MATKRELCQVEEAGWLAFVRGLERIPEHRCEEIGYEAGWSVKDMVGHIGSWHAEAVQILERIRMGTDRPERLDIDAMNARFVEANRDQPVSVVKAQCAASRTRMLQEFDRLEALTPRGEEWFVECGAHHYDEHLPRLLEWADELAAGPA
jgi:Mycothiol maleylpyruvate isomerase N-terminal domain